MKRLEVLKLKMCKCLKEIKENINSNWRKSTNPLNNVLKKQTGEGNYLRVEN